MDEVTVRFLPPTPSLRDTMVFYYVVRIGEDPVEDLLHPEGAHIRLILAGDWRITFADGAQATASGPSAVITGALSRAATVHGPAGGIMVSVGLLPPGWALLSDQSAAAYVDDLKPLSDLVGDAASEIVEALDAAADDESYGRALDAWFLKRRALRPPTDPLVAGVHVGLMDEGVASVAEWARRLGCSTRQLERVVRDHIGITPKRLLRRQRFLRSSASLREQPLGGWGQAIDERYADQPQFIREFNYFMGMPPRVYFARKSPFMSAGAEARKALAAG
ncbi:helix-turn-helix domain-containing protein [Phenylobacterium sp.]|uniref:helix-turn-helix domain-containing protein n=1 Tax=Phenylobacterium sp. TaxID=1871053 RepID=UPI002BEB98D2|nr:helix-turn-helix domain-containing protein [Phenylobacterium sp.]HLZ76214.1 helix-turn-helix domain-containing protein [Phenylobacterium sp.]